MGAMKTVAQLEADWVTQGNIAKVRMALAAEKNEAKRAGLEKLLAEQLALLTD